MTAFEISIRDFLSAINFYADIKHYKAAVVELDGRLRTTQDEDGNVSLVWDVQRRAGSWCMSVEIQEARTLFRWSGGKIAAVLNEDFPALSDFYEALAA